MGTWWSRSGLLLERIVSALEKEMILILIAIFIAAVMSVVLVLLADEKMSLLLMSAGALLTIATGIASVSYAFTAWSWFAAEYKAEIINREYGTDYTKAEVFWASDVIDTVRELDRKRIELNGDIMRGDGR